MSNRLVASKENPSPEPSVRFDHDKAKKVFYFLDINDETKKDYQARIMYFLNFITDKGMDRDTFLEYKNYLKSRSDYTVSTKNKYLVTAKVFLKELNRRGILPADITQNIKSFSQALFVCKSNNNKNKRITTRGLRMITKKVLNDLEIDKCVHGFRHYFTTTLIKNYKGDLLRVAQYTRHRSLEMLQIYNDNIKMEEDLPRYYKTFAGVKF